MKHARVTTKTPQPDGTILIEKKSYYEELNAIEEEIQQSIKTNKAKFLTDLMTCIRPISDGTSKRVTLVIEANDQQEPVRIVKTWITRKEYYGR